ncbi:MAG: IclR family transcriptional regulator [Burkholderiales bacterium]|nr:IclR family transcriptional regulator [Burkholderiales bacterium]
MQDSIVRGTRTLARSVALLKAVATRPMQGWRLTDLASSCGFDKGSTHRMLAGLARERLVEQRRGDRHYLPGPLLFELGLAVPRLAGVVARCAPTLARLARNSPGVALLFLPSGTEFVCADRAGPDTIIGLSIEVGTRRPLLASAGGVAMLLALPEAEQEPIVRANLRQLQGLSPTRRAAVQRMLRRSRRAGFGVNLGDLVPGIHAFGVPLLDLGGRPFASLSIVGRAQSMPLARSAEFEALLRAEAARVERIPAGAE